MWREEHGGGGGENIKTENILKLLRGYTKNLKAIKIVYSRDIR